ncbi:MAG: alpha/beta hydrolase [Candidatus Lokiarchaeota archaeon]|nr:alpha/beta hydrolase [Candidatus Lokiarchaeota archaeon]
MAYFKHDGLEFYYIVEGKGEPLVLISGLGSKNSWEFQIPYFSKTMRIITLHNRGVGKSSRPDYPYTMTMYIDDIKALLDHLEIKEKVNICGISMGGMIAQQFVLKYPEIVKKLILCATTAYHGEASSVINSQKEMANSTLEQKFKVRVAALYSRPFRKKLKTDVQTYEILKNNFMEDPTRPQDFINQGAAVRDHDTRDQLSKISQPTLILVGNEDRIILGLHHSELLNDKIPNSTLKIIEKTGHGFIVEEADTVNELIRDFINEDPS